MAKGKLPIINEQTMAAIGMMIARGEIKEFKEVFDYVPKTHIGLVTEAKNHNRVSAWQHDASEMTLREMRKLAAAFQIQLKILIDLIAASESAPAK